MSKSASTSDAGGPAPGSPPQVFCEKLKNSLSTNGPTQCAGTWSGVVEGLACGLEAVEVAVGADLVGQAEAVELAAEVVAGLGDGQDDPALVQVVGQLEQGLGAGVVDVVDRLGVQDEPARRTGTLTRRMASSDRRTALA